MSENERRHGDPLDYADIPGEGDLSADYREAVMPQHVKDAIAARKHAAPGGEDRQVGERP